MAAVRLRTVPDPLLRRAVPPLDLVGDQRWPRHELGRVIMGMLDTMYRLDGIGLAAPQVGVEAQIIVVDPEHDRHQAKVLINPVIVERAIDREDDWEGCLSVPGKRGLVSRPRSIRVRYYDAELFPSELDADGLLARVIQHECDHLQGVLFTDLLQR